MSVATHDDVARLFPDVQDHGILEILATRATLGDLEAAMALLREDDEGLIDRKADRGDRLNHLVEILARSGSEIEDDEER